MDDNQYSEQQTGYLFPNNPSGLYEEEERDGWAIAPEIEKNPKSLDYSGMQITCLPTEIFSNFALTILNLSNNKIVCLPEDMKQLSILEELYLSHNRLGVGPRLEFSGLNNLSILKISHNNLQEIPYNIGLLSNLKYLDLSHNQITELSQSMEHLSSLETLKLENNQITKVLAEIFFLKNLKEINLSNNQLSSLENVVFPCHSKRIDLSYNQLSFVHPSQFSVCDEIQYLCLSNNQICYLDEEMFLQQMHSLEEFHLSGNQLQELPYSIGALLSIQLLNVSGNRLWNIPVSLGYLIHLKSLYLNSNCIQLLPRSIGNLSSLELFDISCKFLFFTLEELPTKFLVL